MDPAVDNASIRWPLILFPELHNITFEFLPVIVIEVILQSIHAMHCSVPSAVAISTSSQQLNIGGENFLDVSSLSLTNIGLRDWSSGLLSGLHLLDLSDIPAFSPSLQQLLDVLAASPHLEKLNLSEVTPTIDGTSVRRPPIPLPDLRYLSFGNLQTIIVDVILLSVHAAYCPIVNLYYGPEPTPTRSTFPAIASFVTPSLYRYFTTAREPITMTFRGDGFEFTVDSEKYLDNIRPSFNINIGSFSIDTDAMIKWVDSLTESKMLNPYPLHLTVNLFNKETVDRVCASKWRFTHIDGVKVRKHGTELCWFLSFPMDLGNGGYSWPGPDVRMIEFDDSPELDAEVVLEMVRRRTTASRGVDQNSVAPLEELVISGESTIASVPLVEVGAGKEQMTCEGLEETVRRIIAAGPSGSSDGDVTSVVIAG
ncbi:hypothetical protein FRB95_000485 [Tulasnella sp. JGI-2019a]|nr:hypothetical protein FRB95_000485 [Tulasnella sp. JGI-2019a]